MRIISLKAIPNQSFNIFIGGSNYDITLKATNGVMSAEIVRDNELIVTGQRIVAGEFLLPYKYQEQGNFGFLTSNDDIPYYTQFGVDQTFCFFTPEDIVELGR